MTDFDIFEVSDNLVVRVATPQSSYDLEQVAVIFVGARRAVLPVTIAQLAEADWGPKVTTQFPEDGTA